MKRSALAALGTGTTLILVPLLAPIPWSHSLLAVAIAAVTVALMALGAARGGSLGRAAVPLALLLFWLAACLLAMVALAGRVAEGPWIGGLPLAAAIQIYGLGLAPLLFVTLTYALTFGELGPTAGDLERLRAMRRRAGEPTE